MLQEIQEEVVADLHSCLEQLTCRCTEMELKIEKLKQSALYHMQLSKRESTPPGVARERSRARMFMQDRLRIQSEHDKALRSMHMLQQQIDSIVSSHVDMVIVDAMRGYNATAARMGLAQKTAEIEKLGESLSDRNHEAATLQEAMSAFTTGDDEHFTSDDMLMRELDDLLDAPLSPLLNIPSPPLSVPLSVPLDTALDKALDKALDTALDMTVPLPLEKKLITVLASASFD